MSVEIASIVIGGCSHLFKCDPFIWVYGALVAQGVFFGESASNLWPYKNKSCRRTTFGPIEISPHHGA